MQWSSSRIKFPNLRFKDFHFFRIFANISRTKKNLRPKILFVRPKIVFSSEIFTKIFNFFSKTFFSLLTFFRTNTFFCGQKLKMAQNVLELARNSDKFTKALHCTLGVGNLFCTAKTDSKLKFSCGQALL